MAQAIDKTSHNGYQTWHREYDVEVLKWLRDPVNKETTANEFIRFLQALHGKANLRARFPNAVQILQDAPY